MKYSNNPKFLKLLIYKLAESAYQKEIVEPGMEDLEDESKEDWINGCIEYHLDSLNITEFPTQNENPNPKSKLMAKKFYGIPLGTHVTIDTTRSLFRVPGGWVYERSHPESQSSCFVPYDEEYEFMVNDDEEN